MVFLITLGEYIEIGEWMDEWNKNCIIDFTVKQYIFERKDVYTQ